MGMVSVNRANLARRAGFYGWARENLMSDRGYRHFERGPLNRKRGIFDDRHLNRLFRPADARSIAVAASLTLAIS